MATIKSYTDLEQSRKLAEILPLESADMFYTTNRDWEGDIIGLLDVPLYIGSDGFIDTEMGEIYAWSLAALLGVLPRKVELEDTAYTIGVSLDSINYSNVNNGNLLLEVKVKDNLVDACYEAIVFLHEQKLL